LGRYCVQDWIIILIISVKKFDPCFIVPCFFRECIIFMEFIALNHGNFHLANTDIHFTEFLQKPRGNNKNIRIKFL
jgi:hypothetical protein